MWGEVLQRDHKESRNGNFGALQGARHTCQKIAMRGVFHGGAARRHEIGLGRFHGGAARNPEM